MVCCTPSGLHMRYVRQAVTLDRQLYPGDVWDSRVGLCSMGAYEYVARLMIRMTV